MQALYRDDLVINNYYPILQSQAQRRDDLLKDFPKVEYPNASKAVILLSALEHGPLTIMILWLEALAALPCRRRSYGDGAQSGEGGGGMDSLILGFILGHRTPT